MPLVDPMSSGKNGAGVGGCGGVANHSGVEAAMWNNIGVAAKYRATYSSSGRTGPKTGPRSWATASAYDNIVHENNSAVKVKCEAGGSSSSRSATPPPMANHMDAKPAVKAEKERPLTEKELEDIRRHNVEVRNLVYKEIRRKGTSEYL